MDITFLIALIALTISSASAVNNFIKRRNVPELGFYFQNEQVESLYYDEEKDHLNFPHYTTDEAAGFDIRSNETITLDPGQFMTIKTGLHFNIPNGYELQIRSRSGLAAKYGIQVLNSPGTVDSDYTGEVKVILKNSGANTITINYGERIAQAVFTQVTNRPTTFQIKDKSHLGTTKRGEKGLGSTGVK